MEEGLPSHRKVGKEVVEERMKVDINDLFDLSGESRRQALISATDKGKNVVEARGEGEAPMYQGNLSPQIGGGMEEAFPIRNRRGTYDINWAEVNREINQPITRLEDPPPPVHAPQHCIMTLEYVQRYLNRSKGLGNLSTIHGVDMTNAVANDVNPRSALREQIKQNLANFSPLGSMNDTTNVVETAEGSKGAGTSSTIHDVDMTNAIANDVDPRSDPREQIIQNLADLPPLGSLNDTTNVAEAAEGSGTKSKTRYSVCEQIAKLLSDAGWVVFFRPCNDAEKYDDAVYLSPDGKAYWSIILAYDKLKHHYEAGDGEGVVHGPGFVFTPVPQEDLKMITEETDNKGNGEELVSVEEAVAEVNENAGCAGTRKLRVRRKKRTREKKPFSPFEGKRSMFSWMIDMGTIREHEKVHYYKEQCAVLNGKITRGGIRCACCNGIVTISEFEAHSGNQDSDPLKNIRVEGGASLLQCLEETWNKQDDSYRKTYHFITIEAEDQNDDICSICRDTGNLICCDSCPSTFHPSCLNITTVPDGKWHCIYCRCKYCGLNGGEQMETFAGFLDSMLFGCTMCEQKYHKACLEAIEFNAVHLEQPNLCGSRCEELFERFKLLVGVNHEIKDGYSWTFLRRLDAPGSNNASKIESRMIECNSKLAVAMLVMNECFMPCIDIQSGVDFIHSALYSCGSNFARLNCWRFFTIILQKGEEIISVATIRIHRNTLAEMPFIGTRPLYRRKGMCRRLLNAIESVLTFLNVELLVIPSVVQFRKTWISSFGFEPLDSTTREMIKTLDLLVFPHTDPLQKKITKRDVPGPDLISTKVSNLPPGESAEREADNGDEAEFIGDPMDID